MEITPKNGGLRQKKQSAVIFYHFVRFKNISCFSRTFKIMKQIICHILTAICGWLIVFGPLAVLAIC